VRSLGSKFKRAKVASAVVDVRFGSKADMCGATNDVRFGPKVDMCSAKRHVRFAPERRHVQCKSLCLLWAKSGHSALAIETIICLRRSADFLKQLFVSGAARAFAAASRRRTSYDYLRLPDPRIVKLDRERVME